MPNKAHVSVIDDDDAVRDSLAFLLEAAGIATRAYGSAADFLAAPASEEPACIITDVRMPGMTGTELLRRLKESGRRIPVIVMTGHGDIALAVEAMKLGAVDFFEKPFADEALLGAVRAALEQRATSEETDAERAAVAERLTTLSARELQVLEGLVSGHANKTIAHDLGISPRTVEVYRANLMTKMKASSLSNLVRMALLAEGLGS
jgi:two-component system, LuxR family, response regulator FixJ